MHIVLLGATNRGLRVFERLAQLAPADRITVFSFREEPAEPPFFDAIRSRAGEAGAAFRAGRAVSGEAHQAFWDEPVDLMLAVSWRYLVPPDVYERARLGAYVFHDSQLPRNRGFAPTVWAIAKGEHETGVTLFRMAEAVDTGDIVAQQSVPIGQDDTIRTVMDRVTGAYLSILTDQLPLLRTASARLHPQAHLEATYNARRTDADNRIDWSRPAVELHNLVRAVTRPYGGAWTTLGGERLLVWSARPAAGDTRPSRPGIVTEVHDGRGAIVTTARGSLMVEEVQAGDQHPRRADKVIRAGMRLGT